MKKDDTNWFLKFSHWLNNRANSRAKKTTNIDLFDWLLLFLWASVSVLIALSAEDASLVVGPLVLWFTAFTIVRYTKETYWLKKVAQKQYDYENRPYLRLQWSENPDEVFQIVNDGRGIAVDVCFENLVLQDGPLKTPIVIKCRPAIASGAIRRSRPLKSQRTLDVDVGSI